MLLDIAIGIFTTWGIGSWLGYEPQFLDYCLGVFFALMMDVDFIFHWLESGEVAMHAGNTSDHRDGLHYPLIFIPIGAMLVYPVFGKGWALIFIVATFFHFVHDSFGVGWGVKWLYPFSSNNYKFLCDKEGLPSLSMVVSWTPKEVRSVAAEHGDPEWIQNLFLRPILRGEVPLLIVFEVVLPLCALTYFAVSMF